jgi:hypothetical protein
MVLHSILILFVGMSCFLGGVREEGSRDGLI